MPIYAPAERRRRGCILKNATARSVVFSGPAILAADTRTGKRAAPPPQAGMRKKCGKTWQAPDGGRAESGLSSRHRAADGGMAAKSPRKDAGAVYVRGMAGAGARYGRSRRRAGAVYGRDGASAISCQLSAVSCQLSAISHRLSATGHQPSPPRPPPAILALPYFDSRIFPFDCMVRDPVRPVLRAPRPRLAGPREWRTGLQRQQLEDAS